VDSWQPAYVALGSNQQDPAVQVRNALARIAAMPRTQLVLQSALYGSRPFGKLDQPDFVNAAAGVLTQLSPEMLLAELKTLESALGRPVVHQKWGPRIIDLDLLVHGREQRDRPEFTLPHAGIVERNFVLYPLGEIAPDLDVPGLGRVAKLRQRVGADGLWRL